MNPEEIEQSYRHYILCLNRRDWGSLKDFIHEDVRHNGRPLGLSGYVEMLESNVRDIPDLRFDVAILAVDPPWVAARLVFDCTPTETFLGLPINGRKIAFAENVFYEYLDGKIWDVRSAVDKAAIEAQL